MDNRISSIFVVASLTNISTANYLISAFCKEGLDVFVCSDIANPLANYVAHGAVDIAKICSLNNIFPNLVLFIEGGSMRLLPVGMEKLNCITAWYGIDTHMDYEKHLKLGRLFDISFIAQKEFVQFLHNDGLRQVYWLPLAFAPELLPESIPERTIDIAYIGSDNVAINPHRHALLTQLRQKFSSIYFGLAKPKEMGLIYSSASIVFNKSVKNDVNMRFFESMGAGAVLITDPIYANGLEDLFVEGEHYLVYKNDDELVPLVNKLLSDKAACWKMGASAQRCIMKLHTYRHRSVTIINTAKISQKLNAIKSEDYFAACLALNLYTGALDSLVKAFSGSLKGGHRRYISHAIAILIYSLARLTSLAEWFFSKISK
jgi:hypothetical protein